MRMTKALAKILTAATLFALQHDMLDVLFR